MTYILLSVLGILAGFTSGFFGIGGGSILIPCLMFTGLSFKQAVGISVVQMMFSSIFGSFLNHKQKTLNIQDGIYLGIGGALGALGSGFILKILSEKILIATFAFMLFLSIYRFFKAPLQSEDKEVASPFLYFVIGFIVALIAVSIGVGGAIFLTPLLIGFLHVDMKKAVSLGLFFIVFSSIFGFISLSMNNLINYQHGFLVGTLSLIGAYFGVKLSKKIERPLQKKLLLTLYIAMFIIMVSKLIEKL